MDGYSVKDAAVVLGIPERRVWELLARGVLAGAPEGPNGMIVYLQPKSGQSSVGPSREASAAGAESAGSKANGNGGSGELSPFRELLTEFRNLTERYGQALLALGEARGEVAGLRARVELLEARVDLRLPSTPPAPTVAWEIPELVPEAAPPTFEPDASLQEQAIAEDLEAAEAEEIVAGEDEPAAEPMIDLIEEAAIADALIADEEPIPEPALAESPSIEAMADEPLLADAATDQDVPEVAAEAEAPEVGVPEAPTLEAAAEPAAAALDAAEAPEAVAPEAIEPEAVESEAFQPEPESEAVLPEPESETDAAPEPPRRRSRGGRTATAGFAAALARADDPTLAELPGAEETAAALAALQRDIDASRTLERSADAEALPAESAPEPESHSEPESLAEAPVIETVAADRIEEPLTVADVEAEAESSPEPKAVIEAPATAGQAEVVDEALSTEGPADVVDESPSEATAEPEAAEPPQAAVPSYYSTDVVDPDWFADGDFSWLEAAQAEAMRVEAERAEARETSPESAVADVAEASVEELAPDAAAMAADEGPEPMPATASELEQPDMPPPADEGGDMSPVAIDVGDGESGVAAELAFGDHPATDAAPPGLGHEGFEPSVESQAMAEEEARAAIQDAFEEPHGAEEASPAEVGGSVAVATAVAEAEPGPEAIDEFESAPEETVAADAQEPALAQEVEADEAPSLAQEVEADEAAADVPAAEETPSLEAVAEQPVEVEPVEAEPEAVAIQDAFEPADSPVGDDAHEQHEGEVEAEAIQEAFEEPMPAPEWQAAPERPATTIEDSAPRADETRASDDLPRTMAAAAAAETFHGPEEFIAPPVVMPEPETTSPAAQPRAAAGEEELMWLGDEFEEADLEVAAQGWRSPESASAASATPPPVLELSDAELAQLAEDEGWDLDEVEAIRRLLGRPSDAPLPEAPTATPPNPGAGSGPPLATTVPSPDVTASSAPSVPERPPSNQTGIGQDEIHDPEWLQGRSGAAAEAYRRLRKLFPS